MGALVDSRRTRTAAGALLELSAMANEKLLLHKELDRWKAPARRDPGGGLPRSRPRSGG